ncbi:MAG TPA: molybdenum cofactor guanylyltransferase [Anaeromyxobacter sp.]|nr:molybdenum cofactor guanylyltransferase [Anaeromyxobacter sp.]
MPDGRIEDCTGVLLAGGRAERLGGIPKGLLRHAGKPIAAHVLALFARLFPASLIVSNDAAPYQPLGVSVVPDRLTGRGPPGGIHSALLAAGTSWIFAAACDMPFLAEEPIRFLASRRAGAAAVLVRSGGRLEPLHAFWSQACLPALTRLLAAGKTSLVDLAGAVPSVVVEEPAWRTVDPLGRVLENANTPQDLARLGLDDHQL